MLRTTCSACSPRTRGWSRGQHQRRRPGEVLPAHAGVVPGPGTPPPPVPSAPRARGGGPAATAPTRWPPRCSPRTRGWSLHQRHRRRRARVLPAHAGVVPPATASCPSGRWCSPRTRGWSQQTVGGPGSGVRAPRARGGGPPSARKLCGSSACSPRTRGWSPRPWAPDQLQVVLPAHAGVVPVAYGGPGLRLCAPRARGGGPAAASTPMNDMMCSPRTRGWSLAQQDERLAARVLPAHAGVVPVWDR